MNDFFDLLNGFRINGAFPVDSRFVVADEAARLAIPVNAVYKGLFTFQADNNLLYIYDGDDQTNVDSAWTSFTVNNIDVDNITSVIAPNGNTVVTLPFENGQTSQFVVQRGEVGPESQYSIEVIGEFAEDIIVAAPEGGSYNVDTRELDTTTLTAGWFDPFTQQVPALQDGNAYYRARFLIVPARLAGVTSLVPIWSSPVQLSGDQGPQGLTGAPGAPGNDGDSFVGVVQSTVPSRGGFTEVQPRKQDHNGVITDAGNPIRLAAGFTGASVSDVDIVTQGGTGQPTTIQFEITSDQGATSTLPTLVTIPPGASGSGTGDVLVSGNIAIGQYAKWAGPTSISGQTGVPAVDVTGLSLKDNTTFATIFDDLDTRDVRVQNGRIRLTEADGTQTSSTGFAILNTVMENEATPVQSAALHTEFASKQDNITGDSESITIPQHGSTPSIVFVKANTNLSNVDSTLTDQEKADFRAKIGAGTSTGDLTSKLDTDLSNVASLSTQQQTDFRTAIGAGTGTGVGDVLLNPTGNQTITQPSGTVLDVRGSFDLEDNNGRKALDFSGTSGDIHLEDYNTTTNESNTKVLFDRSSGQLYMNPTSTTLNLPTSDDNKVMRAGGLAIGATSVGHADHSDNNEEAIIEIGYENVEVSTLPLNVETADGDAAETFLKRNTNGEIIFSLSNVIQSGDLRPATSAAVNTAISNSGAFSPGGPDTDGFVLTNDGTGAYNWEVSTGGDGLQVISAFSEITSPTNGQDVYLDTTDGTNRPGIYQYNSTDSEWVIVIGGAGVPFGNTLPITNTGTVGELFRLLQSDGEYSLGFYVRVSNLGTIADWRQLGEETGNGTLPTTNRYDGRVFYLESHEGIDETGWYVWRDADTGIPAGWYKAGTQWEAERIYPEVGGSAPATDHVEPFLLNSGLWNHANQLYIYVGASVSINSATDLFNNSPEEAPDDWETWEDFVARATAGGDATVRTIEPTGVRRTTFPTYDPTTPPGGAGEGQWYWRENQGTNTGLSPTSWADLVVANGDDSTRHQLLCDGTTDQDGNIQTIGANSVTAGVLYVRTATGSALLGVTRFSGNAGNDYRFDIGSIISSIGTPGTSGALSISDQGFASVGNDGRVPEGGGNGRMLIWDHDTGIWRSNVILVDGVDGGQESFGLNSIQEGAEKHLVTRERLDQLYAPLGATGGVTSVRIAINGTGTATNVPASAIAIVSATQQYYNITNATIEVPVQASLSDATTYFSNALQWVQVGDGGGSNNPDSRFSGTPLGLDHSDTGVTVGASIDYNDPSTDAPYTIILPSANTYTFAVGQGISATDAGTTYTIVRLQPTSTVTEFYISGHHASEFPAGTSLFVSEDGHKQNSIWTLPTQGASAYTQDDNVLNDILSKEASLTEQVQANSTAIAAFQADLVSIAAYQPQGAYLSGAGDITPSYSTDQVDRSGSKTGTGYANTGAIRVYHNGDFEVLTYLLMPEGTNTDGTGTNAPDVDYVSAFEEQFKTEDIIGHALVSGAYNTQGFPHVMNTTLETSYDNGYGTGLKAYFLGGQYQGRVEVRFQGTLTPSQNSDRTFITDHSDRTILYDNYTSYQIFPTNAFWHNVRIADPEQIFLIKEGVYLLHEIADAAVPANIGKVLSVTQDQNRVDTFNFPAGSNLSGDLSFTLSRPPSGNVTFAATSGSDISNASITNTGSLITFDYIGTVAAGSFTATYATTGIEALAYTGEFDNFKQGGFWSAWVGGDKTRSTNQTIDGITGLDYTAYSNIPGFTDTWYQIKKATVTNGALASTTKGTVWTTVLTGVGTHASTFNY